MIVVIPAYEPDEKLLGVIRDFTEQTTYPIIVVNDGSGEACRPVFDAAKSNARVTLLEHSVNRGKGAALKTAYSYIFEHYPESESVLTVDADGQHLVADAVRVAEKLEAHPDALVLGSRQFTGNVPFRSRMGNGITRGVFHFTTGKKVYDTQTGLRAFSVKRIPEMVALKGDRYEYEINQLVYCAQHRIEIVETWIETVYLEDNKSSHFNTLKDSFRIYKVLLLGTSFLKFVASSFSCFLIDYAVYAALLGITSQFIVDEKTQAAISVVGARVVSSTCNYFFNKIFVFHAKDARMSFLKYVVLTCLILALQSGLTAGAVAIGLNKWIVYIPVQIIVYPLSYLLQRAIVFRKKEQKDQME